MDIQFGGNTGLHAAQERQELLMAMTGLASEKTPGIRSEMLDWVKALTLLNVNSLNQELVTRLYTIVKYEGDVRKAQEELKDDTCAACARVAAPKPQRQGSFELIAMRLEREVG